MTLCFQWSDRFHPHTGTSGLLTILPGTAYPCLPSSPPLLPSILPKALPFFHSFSLQFFDDIFVLLCFHRLTHLISSVTTVTLRPRPTLSSRVHVYWATTCSCVHTCVNDFPVTASHLIIIDQLCVTGLAQGPVTADIKSIHIIKLQHWYG